MSGSTIHVEPTSTGRWTVRHEGAAESLSDHGDANDAQRVARDLAQHEGASSVLLHDCYGRVHSVRFEHAAPTGPDPVDSD
jgi:hypothetical protein